MRHASPRIVWVTGASSGIGSALAESFASHGDVVYASGRNRRKLQTLARKTRDNGAQIQTIVCDVRKRGEVAAASRIILKKEGKVHILVNNAGVTYFKDFLGTTPREFDEVIGTNLMGLFLTTRSILPSMMKRKDGLIINVLSFAVKKVYTLSAAYTASKAGASSLMDVLREEVRPHGIKVMNVYPGAIHTPMWSNKHRMKYGSQMMTSHEAAEIIYQASLQTNNVMIEELVVRPQVGDLKV